MKLISLACWDFSLSLQATAWGLLFKIVQTIKKAMNALTFSNEDITEAPIVVKLRADPGNLEFDLVPIFSSKSLNVTIINHGLTPVSANLIMCHEQWLRSFSSKLATVSPNFIQLAPREATSVTITVRPLRLNIQNFYVVYEEICTADECLDRPTRASQFDMDEIMSKRLVDLTFIGDHATLKIIDMILLGRNPVWTSPQCWSKFSIDKLNECLTPAHHCAEEGSVPKVPTVTFRFPSAPVDSDESVAQLLLNNSSHNGGVQGHWQIYTAPPRNWENYLSRKPRSSLDVTKEEFKDNPDLLSHIWADKMKLEGSEPEINESGPLETIDLKSSKKSLKAQGSLSRYSFQSNVPHSKLFNISKTNGYLDEDETQLLTIQYKYETVGTQKMYVLLRVYPAVFIWIDLVGKTLDSHQPSLELMHHDFVEFHPIAVSDMDPPLQTIWMFNGGNVPSSFTVDTTPFDDLKKENYDHAVIECLTEEGVAKPHSFFPIKLRFSPLEMDSYEAKLRIVPEFNEKALEVTVMGTGGMNHEPSLVSLPHGSLSDEQTAILYDRNVPISLNPLVIAFPHFIPTGQSSSSCVFLTNLHTENTLKFRWPEVHLEGGGVIVFKPDTGRIGPREEVACLLTVKAGSVTTVVNLTARCLVEDENEVTLYGFAMKQWNHQFRTRVFEDSKAQNIQAGDSYFCTNPPPPPRPPAPKPMSVLLGISLYIGSVAGLHDAISLKEKVKMNHPENLENLYPLEGESNISLSKFERELSEDVISQTLWDMIFNPSFENQVRQATRRQAPHYDQYKMSCETEEDEEAAQIPLQPVEEIIDAAVFNLIQEISSNFIDPDTREDWPNIPAVQPTAFVNESKLTEYM